MSKGLEELGVLHKAAPRRRWSVLVAHALYEHMAEIERLVWEHGQLYQSERAEAQEWRRLVALVIEAAVAKTDIGVNDDERKSQTFSRSIAT